MTFPEFLEIYNPEAATAPQVVVKLCRQLRAKFAHTPPAEPLILESDLVKLTSTFAAPTEAAKLLWQTYNSVAAAHRAELLQSLVMSEALRLAELVAVSRPWLGAKGDVWSNVTRLEAIGLLAEGIYGLASGPQHPNNQTLIEGLGQRMIKVHTDFCQPQLAAIKPPATRPSLLN